MTKERAPSRLPTRKLFKQFVADGTEDLNLWRERFIAEGDPTEYAGAMELVGSWQEWCRFKKEWPEFASSILPEWLDELEVKLRSGAIKRICSSALSEGKDGVVAAKWIAEGGYKEKKAGRPTHRQRERENKIEERLTTAIDDDVARVMKVHDTQH
jgi:hypothetical protein